MIKVRASPSLALIKYWGKSDSIQNLPATSSLAVGLEELWTETCVSLSKESDQVVINGSLSDPKRYVSFFDTLRKELDTEVHFFAESSLNFPLSAGLASSSSGFAALAYGACQLIDPKTPNETISSLARIGSASAARAIYGGFTSLKKGARFATSLFDSFHWPELKVIIAVVRSEPKKVSSRKAMELSKISSPYYATWIKESDKLFELAIQACRNKNLNELGPLIRQSYLMMFSTMFTSVPPLFYWEPASVALIQECDALRVDGYSIWETMDAGPQVKMICLESELPSLLDHFQGKFATVDFLTASIGGNLRVL